MFTTQIFNKTNIAEKKKNGNQNTINFLVIQQYFRTITDNGILLPFISIVRLKRKENKIFVDFAQLGFVTNQSNNNYLLNTTQILNRINFTHKIELQLKYYYLPRYLMVFINIMYCITRKLQWQLKEYYLPRQLMEFYQCVFLLSVKKNNKVFVNFTQLGVPDPSNFNQLLTGTFSHS
eukprot:TRINITY_DN3826_c1_g1_i4.p4 TRINITY_DN3826_c1_g1~~TRINITY_DN3826_c1_g1_i4.p4  ORF type:complete len:178 (-),score=3.62 TRINITY_DN3826_c1_g1_i4:29-562(-)